MVQVKSLFAFLRESQRLIKNLSLGLVILSLFACSTVRKPLAVPTLTTKKTTTCCTPDAKTPPNTATLSHATRTLVPQTTVSLAPPFTASTIPPTLAVTNSPAFTPTLITLTGIPESTSTILPDTPTVTPLVYFFPVQPFEVASYARGHHDYPATDIFAPQGTKFVAVTRGVIDFVSYKDSWDPTEDDPATRGGLSVAIIGDDGVRYYGSHLSAIESGMMPGVRVAAGQILGYIGNSGNARYIDCHLHFGISHPSYPEDWKVRRGEIDPYPYLQAWAHHENLTPELP